VKVEVPKVERPEKNPTLKPMVAEPAKPADAAPRMTPVTPANAAIPEQR
jgi:hypothetical protein